MYKKWTDADINKFKAQCQKWWKSDKLTLGSLYIHLKINSDYVWRYKKENPQLYACVQWYKNLLIDKIENIMLDCEGRDFRKYETYLRQITFNYRQSFQDKQVESNSSDKKSNVVIDLSSESDIKIGGK